MPTINYGTSKLIAQRPAPAPPPSSVTGLAGSMNKLGTPIGINPNLMVPGSTPGVPTTVGRQVQQPMRQLDFSGGQQQLPGNLPPSDTTTQTGQGGGQSSVPGASAGQTGQAQGVGRQPTNAAIPKPGPDPLPTSSRPQQTVGVLPGMEGGSKTPIGAVPGAPTATNLPIGVLDRSPIPMPKPDPNTLKTPVGSTPQTGVGAGLQYGYPSTLLHPNGVTNANDTTPSWYAPISGAPKPPAGGDTTQKFSTNFQPTGSTAFSKMVQQALDRQQYGQKGVDLQNMPTSFTIADFNNTAQTNPVLAQQMLAKGGQAYRDAVMKANGWTNLQMNQFINAYGSSVEPGITQQNLTEAGFTPDRFGTNTLTPVVSAPPPPVNQPAPPPPASTGATADQGTEPGYGYFSPYWTNLYGGAVR